MSQKQAKRRRREQRARARQEASSQNGVAHEEVIDLEELIEAGNIDEYARVCWPLANEAEGPPQGRRRLIDSSEFALRRCWGEPADVVPWQTSPGRRSDDRVPVDPRLCGAND